MRLRCLPLLITLACALGGNSIANAQPAPAAPVQVMVARENAGVVGVITGGISGTYARVGADLANVLDGNGLRVLPILGKGSLQNVSDVLFLRGVDVGIVQSDVLSYVKSQNLFPTAAASLAYIAKLYDEEVHLLVGPNIHTLADLNGQKVNIDTTGSGSAMTASLVFQKLGVSPDFTHDPPAIALEKLKNGDYAGMVYVVGKPAPLFADIPASSGLHFLPVPLTPELLDTYLPAKLDHAAYPALVPQDIDTIAVGAVMAVYRWPDDSERYRKVARFVNKFFDNFDHFLHPPQSPKWREVNLAADLPGWTRFRPAQDWLNAHATPSAPKSGETAQEFDEFIATRNSAGSMSPAQRDELFQQFLQWRAAHASAQR